MTAGFNQVSPLSETAAMSPVALVKQCLLRIDETRDSNAFITIDRERAIADAGRLAKEGETNPASRGVLHGVPVAVKDIVDVEGLPTTSASAIPAAPAVRDAPVVANLRKAGAIVIGKTNLHEFAFGTTGDETAFGPVRHPRDPARSAGGSSSGSAVAIVNGCCLGAIGTDTGGSIRIPSAACGIVGLKPSLGEISCEGVVPLSTTFDHVGPMARTVAAVSLLFQVMKGAEPQSIAPARGSLRFGVPRPYFCDRLDPGVREALEGACDRLRRAGHTVVDVEIAHASWTPHVYLHLTLPEAACSHAPLLTAHAHEYSPGVRLRLEMGRYVLAEDYVRALRLRDRLTRAVDALLSDYDGLLLPALAIPAPLLGAASVDVEGHHEPVRAVMLKLTQLFNITGHPAISLPAGDGPDGLPRGLQLVGHRDGTMRLLELAHAIEPYMVAGPGSVGGGTG